MGQGQTNRLLYYNTARSLLIWLWRRFLPLLYHTFENMVLFGPGNVYSLCSPGNQDYQKIIIFFIKKGRNRQCKSSIFWNYQCSCNYEWIMDQDSWFPGLLSAYKFPAQKLPHSQICDTKVGRSYKKRRICFLRVHR